MSTEIAEQDEWYENRARDRAIPRLRLSEFWTSRELSYFFALRDVKVRYKQAILGFAGVILQPLVGALAFTFVFNGIADIQSEGPYFLVALSGFAAWNFIAAAIAGGSGSLLEHADLISHVRFPMLAAPVSSMLVAFVDFCLASLVVLILSIAFGSGVSLLGLAIGLPLAIALMAVFVLGPGLIFAPLLVKYRDSGSFLGVGLQLAFFLGPVAYPPESLDEKWQRLQYVNPTTGVLSLYRWGMTNGPTPAVRDVAVSAAVAVVLALIGLTTFRRNEQLLVDVI